MTEPTSGSGGGATETGASKTDGQLAIVGLGPGHPEGLTIRARRALELADHVVGYDTYVDLVPEPLLGGTTVTATGMGTEVERTEVAVEAALGGDWVALVGSGDPNVYALAGLALEVLESQEIDPESIGFEVIPGVPAANASAARLGAPLVNDAVTISLSDHLTPREEIESRLRAVAGEDFAIALYNPWSPAREENFQAACEILLAHRDPETPVGIVHAAGRPDESTRITTLDALPAMADEPALDMTSTVLIGTEQTRVWGDRLLRPRGYASKYDY